MPVSESFPVRGGMLAVGCLTAAILFAVTIPDKGEVVRLTTRDAEGQERDTDLWIAEVEGEVYFRAASPRVNWLARLESSDRSYLEREGRMIEIETEVEHDLKLQALLNRAMAQKYGLADRIWGSVRSSNSVAIRIRPVVSHETVAQQDEQEELPTHLDAQ